MKNWIVRWVANVLALLIVTVTVPGIHLDHKQPLLLVVAVVALAFANAIIRPIIMFFVWPINCLTFGLLGFVINALFFFIVGNLHLGFIVEPGVTGMIGALIGSIAMGILSGLINFILKDRGDRDESE